MGGALKRETILQYLQFLNFSSLEVHLTSLFCFSV